MWTYTLYSKFEYESLIYMFKKQRLCVLPEALLSVAAPFPVMDDDGDGASARDGAGD